MNSPSFSEIMNSRLAGAMTSLLAIAVFLFIFRFLIDFIPSIESIGGKRLDKIVTFFVAILTASLAGLLMKLAINPAAAELRMGIIFGVTGFVYMYIYYPAQYFEQSVLLTLTQVVLDPVSLINMCQLILEPVLFATCLKWARKRYQVRE